MVVGHGQFCRVGHWNDTKPSRSCVTERLCGSGVGGVLEHDPYRTGLEQCASRGCRWDGQALRRGDHRSHINRLRQGAHRPVSIGGSRQSAVFPVFEKGSDESPALLFEGRAC